MVSVIEESKSVMEAHVSAILAAAVVKGGEMGAGSDASSEADLALQLFATLQGKTSVEVDLMVESSKGCIHRLVEIGVKLGGMSAAASGKQVQIREDAEYRKVRTDPSLSAFPLPVLFPETPRHAFHFPFLLSGVRSSRSAPQIEPAPVPPLSHGLQCLACMRCDL